MKSIRAKLIAAIALPTLGVYVAILGCTLVVLRGRSLAEVERNMTRLASNYAARFDGFLREAAAVANTSSHFLAVGRRLSEREIYDHLRANVAQNTFIYGACTAFEPGAYKEGTDLFAPYVHRAENGLAEMNINRDVYDWYNDPQWTWFQEPKALGRGVWSEPYFDEGAGNVLMTTYSAPVYEGERFLAVTTVDIHLPRLRDTIGRHIADDLDFVILTGEGRFVFDPKPERILKQTLARVAVDLASPSLQAAVPRILSGKPGVAGVTGWDDAGAQRLFFAPIPSTEWVFIARMPERAALANVRTNMVVATIALTATLALIVGCIAGVSTRLTRPLSRMTLKVQEIAGGNLGVRVEGPTTGDEIGVLAESFNQMTSRLAEHVSRLAEEETARRKTEHDLAIARDIQRGLLPVLQPDVPGYEVAGWSQPADQTGGDYFDWQSLPNGNTVITLADVTGHGIGPALVTAVCRAYARASFPQDVNLGSVLDRINDLLCEDLKDGRFVTFVAAFFEPSSHSVQLLSAGHGPLLFYHAAEHRVEDFHAQDIPLGLSPRIGYGPPLRLALNPGDFLLLITDGFFEWPNAEGDQFGLERLERAILSAHDCSASELIRRLYEQVHEFAGGAAQLDDLTAVVLMRTRES